MARVGRGAKTGLACLHKVPNERKGTTIDSRRRLVAVVPRVVMGGNGYR